MKKILLTGSTGQLGWELQQALVPLGEIIAPVRAQMDLSDPDSIRKFVRDVAPDVIVNAAGYTTVDKAEEERELAYQINAIAPGLLAEEARRTNALLVHYSTDYVFDGTKPTPYEEDDTTNPLNVYGHSKLEGERAVVATGCAHVILRASWIYSDRGANFVLTMLRLAREKSALYVVNDQVGSPTWARSLAASSVKIISKINKLKDVTGIYHLSAAGHATRLEFAEMIVALAKKTSSPDTQWANILPTTTEKYPLPAQRPLYAATSKAKVNHCFGIGMTTWQEQLEMFMKSLPA